MLCRSLSKRLSVKAGTQALLGELCVGEQVNMQVLAQNHRFFVGADQEDSEKPRTDSEMLAM